MKNHEFFVHLAEDVIKENHHLKEQLIRQRKQLKKYEQVMLEQISKYANKISEKKVMTVHDINNNEQYLAYFIEMIHAYFEKTEQLKVEIQNKRLQISLLQSQIQEKNENLIAAQKSNEEKCKQIKQLKKQNHSLSEERKKEQRARLKQEENVASLKAQAINMEREHEKRLEEVRKMITNKANRDIAEFRMKADEQIFLRENKLRVELQKGNEKIKELMRTIGIIFGQRQISDTLFDKQNSEETSEKNEGKTNQPDLPLNKAIKFSNQLPLQALKQIVRPFCEHTALTQANEKLIKQYMLLSNTHRQTCTTLFALQSELIQKKQQIISFEIKCQTFARQYEQLTGLYKQTIKDYQVCEEDKQNLQKYYDDKWNTEFANVRFHLEKKYNERKSVLEREYLQLRIGIEEQRMIVKQQIAYVKAEMQKVMELNAQLNHQMLALAKQNEGNIRKIEAMSILFKNVENMHQQDMMGHIIRKQEIKREMQSKINEAFQQNQLQQQCHRQQIEKYVSKINQQKQIAHQELVSLKESLHRKNNAEMGEKEYQIQKLMHEVQSHKKVLKEEHRDLSTKMETYSKAWEAEKQSQIRKIKTAHFQEQHKLNQKLLKLEKQVSSFHKTLEDQRYHKTEEMKYVEKDNREKEKEIKELTNAIAKLQLSQQEFQEKYVSLLQKVNTLEIARNSAQVMLNSRQTQISTLNLEIKELVKEKKQWASDVQGCRQEFEKGFLELKKLHEKKVLFYHSRIWELEGMLKDSGIKKRDLDKIRALTEEKKKIEEKMNMKVAQNLVLTQVKQYYENKAREMDSKISITYELSNSCKNQSIFVRRPHSRKKSKIQSIKTLPSEQMVNMALGSACELKKSMSSSQNQQNKTANHFHKSKQQQKRAHTMNNRSGHRKQRVNSSIQ